MDALDDGSECTAASERGGSAGSLPSGYLCDWGLWSRQLFCFRGDSPLCTVEVLVHRSRGVPGAGGRTWLLWQWLLP